MDSGDRIGIAHGIDTLAELLHDILGIKGQLILFRFNQNAVAALLETEIEALNPIPRGLLFGIEDGFQGLDDSLQLFLFPLEISRFPFQLLQLRIDSLKLLLRVGQFCARNADRLIVFQLIASCTGMQAGEGYRFPARPAKDAGSYPAQASISGVSRTGVSGVSLLPSLATSNASNCLKTPGNQK